MENIRIISQVIKDVIHNTFKAVKVELGKDGHFGGRYACHKIGLYHTTVHVIVT